MASQVAVRVEAPAFAARRPAFDLLDPLARDWHSDSAVKTAFFNAMSLIFPVGEKFFIDSVRHFRDQIDDPDLLRDIAAFQAQEGIHRLQHQRYNEALCELRGYDLDRLERQIRRRMIWAKANFRPRQLLASTVVCEHLTAVLAHDVLSSDDALEGADPAVASLWRWHGVEEAEHKSVAFDTFVAVGGTKLELRRALVMGTVFFLNDIFRNMGLLLSHDGKLWDRAEWSAGFRFLFTEPGVMRRNVGAYLRFWGRDFHPWNQDDRELIANWQRRESADLLPDLGGAGELAARR